MPRGIGTEFVKITPTAAATMLESNAVNRRIRPRLVGAYASDMRDGLWQRLSNSNRVRG